MRRKTYPVPKSKPLELREAATLAGTAARVNVRAAKDRFSSLVELAANGHEVVITSDGRPKAKLVPCDMKTKRLQVNWELLRSQPLRPGAKPAEAIIREDRDGRP